MLSVNILKRTGAGVVFLDGLQQPFVDDLGALILLCLELGLGVPLHLLGLYLLLLLVVVGKVVHHNGDGQGQDQDSADSTHGAYQLARDGLDGEVSIAKRCEGLLK